MARRLLPLLHVLLRLSQLFPKSRVEFFDVGQLSAEVLNLIILEACLEFSLFNVFTEQIWSLFIEIPEVIYLVSCGPARLCYGDLAHF